MVGALGLEPRTSALSERRSSQLSYAPGPVATIGSLRSVHRGSRTGPGAREPRSADPSSGALGGRRATASHTRGSAGEGPGSAGKRPPEGPVDATSAGRRGRTRAGPKPARGPRRRRAGRNSTTGPETKRARGRRRRPRARKKRPALTYFPVFDSIIGPAGLTAEFGMGSGGTPRV